MTRSDIERYIREQTGVTTGGEQSRKLDQVIRHREPNADLVRIEPTSYARPPFLLPGFLATDSTSNTTPTTNRTVASYIGQAPADIQLVTLRVNVVTAVATITWAEVGVATSADFEIGAATMDLLPNGFTNVATTFNSTGNKNTEVTVNIARGQHCWALWGQQATTLYVLRAGIGDAVTSGRRQFADATRPSTMANPTTFAVTAGAASNAWIEASW